MGCLSLDRDRCWVDCWAFEEAAGRARLAEGAGQSQEARRHLEEARSLYQGDYLPALKHEAWIDAKRQALRQRYAWVEQRLQP
jgi:DNA-binding SARP family transcriptional activator